MKHKLILLSLFMIPALVYGQVSQTAPDTLAREIDSLKKDVSVLKRIKISGYIQPQIQVADSAGQQSFNGGNFAPGQDLRFQVRRARLKIQYNSAPNAKGISVSQYTFQPEVTERGIALKEAYARVTDPWYGWLSLTLGMFDNPFGYECPYSSGLRETPERGRMSQLHFPNESEVGVMLSIHAPKSSKLKGFRWDISMLNGNGGPSAGVDVSDFDSKKDLSTRISYSDTSHFKNFHYHAGLSYYDGLFRIDSVNVYKPGNDDLGVSGFVSDTKASDNGAIEIGERGYTTRRYYGIDGQVAIKWKPGTTTLRGEYIYGDQPGLSSSTKSPNDRNPITKDIYSRSFSGAYFYFIQNIMKTPLQLVIKYDWYDPNSDVEGDDLGRAVSTTSKSTNESDVRYDTWGFGLNYAFTSNIRFTAYYDMVENETSSNLDGYTTDRPDNQFTFRMQVRF